MNKARIILTTIVLCAILGGTKAYNVNRRGLANLYYRTTGIFVSHGVGRILSYATISPFRTFPTAITQNTVSTTAILYSSTTWTTTTIGGWPYTYEIPTDLAWPAWLVYSDEDQ
jgi:hypothetical protein